MRHPRTESPVCSFEFIDTLVRVLNKQPEHTHIVIQEIEPDDWGLRRSLHLNSEHQRRSSNQ